MNYSSPSTPKRTCSRSSPRTPRFRSPSGTSTASTGGRSRFASEHGLGFLATEGFDQLREAVLFGSSDGPWVQGDDSTRSADGHRRPEPPPTPRQTVLLKNADGEILVKLQPQKRYEWFEGHLASVDGVVYVVVEVLHRSRSNVEVRVERLRMPVDKPTSVQKRPK